MKISKYKLFNYVKFISRILIFIFAVILFFNGGILKNNTLNIVFLSIVWIFYFIGILFKLFPNKFSSTGSQKIFKRYYIPTNSEPKKENRHVVLIAALWIGANLIFGILYILKIFNEDIMILLSLAYFICDSICLLIFCPFRLWINKNRCCVNCRIYNWDCLMLVSPLIFIPHFITYILVVMAIIVLVQWEVIYHKHPERFSEKSNLAIRCSQCTKKSCRCKNK